MEFIKTHSNLFIAKSNITAFEIIDFEGEQWVVANLNSPIIVDPSKYPSGGERTHTCRIARVEGVVTTGYQAISNVISSSTFIL